MKLYTINYTSSGRAYIRAGGQRVYMDQIDRESGLPMVFCNKPFQVVGITYGIKDKLTVNLL